MQVLYTKPDDEIRCAMPSGLRVALSLPPPLYFIIPGVLHYDRP